MTLGDLQERMTVEELQIWMAYLQLESDEQKAAMQKQQRGRR